MPQPPGPATRRLAYLFRTTRARQGWSQRELGRKLGGYSQAYVGKVERCEGETVGVALLEEAMRVCMVVPDYFFDPGPDELDPSEYHPDKRRTLSERLLRLERHADAQRSGSRSKSDSGTHPVTAPSTKPPKR